MIKTSGERQIVTGKVIIDDANSHREIQVFLTEEMSHVYFLVRTNGQKTLKNLRYIIGREDPVRPLFVFDVSQCEHYYSMIIGVLVLYQNKFFPRTMKKLSREDPMLMLQEIIRDQ